MEFVSLALLALAFVALGASATVILAQGITLPVAQRASGNGRFFGLGGEGTMAASAPFRKSVQKEAMNVVRTSN
ncbi:hypothetical protein [Paraburkholderia sp.]|uniref:hypothetical protein n=1 Tax=Paraburkholderia sp. TaxID=1926495 RepID=UPI0023A38990|nr:hypothetical protein [Paraburkholderia sp.]MDE1179752.1 hypothetical protein [Paraburkholderia sp.]